MIPISIVDGVYKPTCNYRAPHCMILSYFEQSQIYRLVVSTHQTKRSQLGIVIWEKYLTPSSIVYVCGSKPLVGGIPTPLKNSSQLGLLYSQYMEK